MAIALRNAGALGTGTTSVSLTQPIGTVAGDVLLAFISDKLNSAANSVAPTGWTARGYANGASGRLQVFYAIVGLNGLTGTSWTWSSLTTASAGVILGYSGVENTNPFDVAPTFRYNASGTTGSAALTTITANAMIVAGFASLANGATWSLPVVTNITPTFRFNGANGTALSLGIADGTRATAGLTGPSSATMSAAAINGGVLIALRPELISGERVSKANVYVVAAPPTGVSVAKANIYAVVAPPTGVSVAKANIYAIVVVSYTAKRGFSNCG